MSQRTHLEQIGIAAFVACAAAAVVVATRGFAGPASPPVSTGSASPSAAASPNAPVEAWVELSSLTIPEDKTAPPTQAEWADARPVLTARRTDAARSCKVHLLREYLKVTCAMKPAGIRQFAGPTDDVSLWVTPFTSHAELHRMEGGRGVLIFPLRRGVGHVFRFFEAVAGYDGGFFPNVGPLVDAYWPAGDPAPTVTIR